nr:MAG TPA: hypothetical protein [Caudoviricetes sp.]
MIGSTFSIALRNFKVNRIVVAYKLLKGGS